MISVEALKEQFSVLDVQAYGKCLVIPKAEFIADLQAMLKELGVSVYPSHMGGPVYLVPLSDLEAKLPAQSPSAPSTQSAQRLQSDEVPKSPSAPVGRGPNWSAKEDETLIALRQSGLIEEEIAKEFVRQFPNRTLIAVKSRLKRLLQAGKIKPRYGGRPKKRKKKYSDDVSVEQMHPGKAFSKPGIRGRPPKVVSTTGLTQKGVGTQSQVSATVGTPVTRATPPFEIKTTLTLNITVDCSDRNAVANFRAIVKELSGVTQKEVASAP